MSRNYLLYPLFYEIRRIISRNNPVLCYYGNVNIGQLLVRKILTDIPYTIGVFIFGWLVNEIQDALTRKSWEKRLKRRTQAAIDSIYEAEDTILGRGKGAERLVYAIKAFMKKEKIKSYQKAQNQILAVFPLTKLSK